MESFSSFGLSDLMDRTGAREERRCQEALSIHGLPVRPSMHQSPGWRKAQVSAGFRGYREVLRISGSRDSLGLREAGLAMVRTRQAAAGDTGEPGEENVRILWAAVAFSNRACGPSEQGQ